MLTTVLLTDSHALAQPLSRLSVTADKRRLQTTDGKPFFWLGDTAWELFHRLNREEALQYLTMRQKQGFNVIQAVALAELDGLRVPNRYGHLPLIEADPARPAVQEGAQNDYWDHVDFIVDAANRMGIRIGFLPTWGGYWDGTESAPVLFNPKNAESYGRFLGARYRNKGIVWILGGDRHIVNEQQKEILRAMARGLRAGDGGNHLMTFHPRGEHSSSEYFHEETWLDFNLRQNGHVSEYEPFGKTRLDFELKPTKPVIDGEPLYEGHPVYRPDGSGFSEALDVRRALYWDLFAGACGHTYGHGAVWQMWNEGREPINQPEMPWQRAINEPGAWQMQHARWLIESRPLEGRIPDNDLIVSADVKKDEIAASRLRFAGTRASNGCFAMIYAPVGRKFRVRLDKLSGRQIVAWWFDPRKGEAKRAGEFPKSGERDFISPNPNQEIDWILVLDDASQGFLPPGKPT